MIWAPCSIAYWIQIIESEVLALPPESKDFKAIIFLHDALFFEIKNEKLEEYVKMCKDCMENVDTVGKFGCSITVPFIAEGEVGNNLAETQEI